MNKVLIIYFSYTGNSKRIAERIHSSIKGDILEIESEEKYSDNYDIVINQGEKEVKNNFKPKLKTKIENLQDYDTIIICSPIWWYTLPPVIKSFLESYDLTDKTIFPVMTNCGYGLKRSISDLKKICMNSKIKKCLDIPFDGNKIQIAPDIIDDWISQLK